jgi:[ribosomal protein S5]-alanine N-acetyltransferase
MSTIYHFFAHLLINYNLTLDPDEGVNFAVKRCTDGALLGSMGVFFRLKHRRAGIGYWIGKAYWGQGYTTEAMRRIVAHIFQTYDVVRIEAHCFGTNPASARVMEKLGMTREGTLRQHFYHVGHDAQYDAHVYAILREVWVRSYMLL